MNDTPVFNIFSNICNDTAVSDSRKIQKTVDLLRQSSIVDLLLDKDNTTLLRQISELFFHQKSTSFPFSILNLLEKNGSNAISQALFDEYLYLFVKEGFKALSGITDNSIGIENIDIMLLQFSSIVPFIHEAVPVIKYIPNIFELFFHLLKSITDKLSDFNCSISSKNSDTTLQTLLKVTRLSLTFLTRVFISESGTHILQSNEYGTLFSCVHDLFSSLFSKDDPVPSPDSDVFMASPLGTPTNIQLISFARILFYLSTS